MDENGLLNSNESAQIVYNFYIANKSSYMTKERIRQPYPKNTFMVVGRRKRNIRLRRTMAKFFGRPRN